MTKNTDHSSQREKCSSANMRLCSLVNIYSPPTFSSKLSNSALPDNDPNVKIVHELINSIFDNKNGFCEVSSSTCSNVSVRRSDQNIDKRLQNWKKTLNERRNIARRIQIKTGKHPAAVLFHRLTTVDDRDKQTVKRLMDYAEIMTPSSLINKQNIQLREYIHPQTCMRINKLTETLPKSIRKGCTRVEISGLPAIAKEEQLGIRKDQGHKKHYQWMRSKVLDQRIEDQCLNIKRVIEYFPDISRLQIEGKGLQNKL